MSLTSIVERTKAANGCKRWQTGPTTPNKYTAVEWEQVSGLMGLGEHYMYPLRASADPVTLQGAAMQNIPPPTSKNQHSESICIIYPQIHLSVGCPKKHV